MFLFPVREERNNMTVDILISHGLSSGCGVCGKTENLQCCPHCKVMLYCNGAHQAAHLESHNPLCKAVSKKCARLESEERALRSNAPFSWLREDVFKNYEGIFWGILETREYMRARFALADALGKINTRTSVQAQVEHLLDMLRLCRSDNMGVRNIVPFLLLRVNRDQQCYDFLKWWHTTGDDHQYDWSNTQLPYLDTRDADVFECVDIFCRRPFSLSHTVAVTLLKIKLLLDLEALQNSIVVGEKVPREILDSIQRHIVRSPIISSNMKLMDCWDHSHTIESLELQVCSLYAAVKTCNPHFWERLVDPGCTPATQPDSCSQSSIEEARLVLEHSYDAWVETPGAIGVIKGLMADDKRGHDVFGVSSNEGLQTASARI